MNRLRWMELILAVGFSGLFLIVYDLAIYDAVIFCFVYYLFLQVAPWKVREK